MGRFSDVYQKKLAIYRARKRNSVGLPTYPDKRIIPDLNGAAVTVLLTNGMVALVDLEDESLVNRYCWQAKLDKGGHWYCYRSYRENGKKKYKYTSLIHSRLGWFRRDRLAAEPSHKSGRLLQCWIFSLRFCRLSLCSLLHIWGCM